MANQLKVTTTLQFPLGDESDPKVTSPITVTINYDQKVPADVKITGSQSNVNLLGLITNAKAAFVQCTSGAGDLKANASSTSVPLKAGQGWWAWFNPDGGLTALTISTTDSARFRTFIFA